MADETNIDGLNKPDPAAKPQNTAREHMIPQSRFNEVNETRKALEARLAKLEQEQKQADEQRLKEQEQWKELAEQRAAQLADLEPYKAQVDEMRAALDATVKARIERLPEDQRTLVPDYGDPRKTLAWLDANEEKLTRPAAPDMDAGARGDSLKTVNLTIEQRQAADKVGMDHERYAELLGLLSGGK